MAEKMLDEANTVSGGQIWSPPTDVSAPSTGRKPPKMVPGSNYSIPMFIFPIMLSISFYFLVAHFFFKAISEPNVFDGDMTAEIWNANHNKMWLDLTGMIVLWLMAFFISKFTTFLTEEWSDIRDRLLNNVLFVMNIAFCLVAFFGWGYITTEHDENSDIKIWMMQEYNYDLNQPSTISKQNISVIDTVTEEKKTVNYYEVEGKVYLATDYDDLTAQIKDDDSAETEGN